jgi:phosphoribosylformylglycinamidine synthase
VPRALCTYRAMNAAIEAGLLHSSHTPTLGGLAVACALAALGGDLGAEIQLDAAPQTGKLSDDALLFAESNSRFVVTCAPAQAAALEAAFRGVPCARVGTVTAGRKLHIATAKRTLVEADLDALRKTFKKTLAGI